MKEMTAFQRNLRFCRKEAGILQQDFAQMLGIPVTTLSGYENGGREPKFSLLIKMADIFGVTVDDLVRGELPREKIYKLAFRDWHEKRFYRVE